MAKSITESDAFLDMPPSAQALYFHLMQNADDEGVIGNARSVMRMCSASNDDAKILLANRFLLSIDAGEDSYILIVKHWRIHNYIQKDRFKESNYRQFLKDLFLDSNGAYTDNPSVGTKPYTECIQTVSKMDTQVRIGKSKDSLELGKDRGGYKGETPPTLPNGEPLPEHLQTGNGNIDSVVADLMAMRERKKNA